jgi:hypothetical protein
VPDLRPRRAREWQATAPQPRPPALRSTQSARHLLIESVADARRLLQNSRLLDQHPVDRVIVRIEALDANVSSFSENKLPWSPIS